MRSAQAASTSSEPVTERRSFGDRTTWRPAASSVLRAGFLVHGVGSRAGAALSPSVAVDSSKVGDVLAGALALGEVRRDRGASRQLRGGGHVPGADLALLASGGGHGLGWTHGAPRSRGVTSAFVRSAVSWAFVRGVGAGLLGAGDAGSLEVGAPEDGGESGGVADPARADDGAEHQQQTTEQRLSHLSPRTVTAARSRRCKPSPSVAGMTGARGAPAEIVRSGSPPWRGRVRA